MQALVLSAVPLFFLVLLALSAAVLVSQAQRISHTSSLSTRILSQSDAVEAALEALSTSVSDYEQSGRPSYLRDYVQRSAVFRLRAQGLLTMVPLDSPARPYVARYVAGMREGTVVIARYLAMVRTGQTARAKAYAQSSAVHKLGTELAARKAAFDAAERSLTIAGFDSFSRWLRRFLIAVLIACVIGIIGTLLATTGFGVRIVRRLEELAANARRRGAGEATKEIRGSDEIAVLDRLYAEITRRLRDALAQKEELLGAYEREHHVASTLQRALLPKELPRIPGVRVEAAYVAATASAEIGGDWYDVFLLSDRVLGIAVGDVEGHGLQAATLMGSARQAIRVAAREKSDPASVLRRVNQAVCADERLLMVTAFFGVLDLQSGTLRYASAGHPPPFLLTPKGKLIALEGRGIALGVNRHAEYTTEEASLTAGGAVVLYTDGMVEAEREYAAGLAKLEAAICAESRSEDGNVAQAIQRRVFTDIEPLHDAAVLFVGITDLLSRVSPESRLQTWRVDAKNEDEAHRVKRAVLWHLGERTPIFDIGAAEAILGELLSNIARHTPGQAEITLEPDHDRMLLHVCDRGRAFRATGEHPPDLLSESGRGLFLVRTLARSVAMARTSSGNRVSVELPALHAVGRPLTTA